MEPDQDPMVRVAVALERIADALDFMTDSDGALFVTVNSLSDIAECVADTSDGNKAFRVGNASEG